MEQNNIELRSDEVQEILTRPPHVLIRYGISTICGVLLILFIGSFFFRYPDIVEGSVIITTENPPVWVVAKSSGKIDELHCMDKQLISKDDLLAVIENPASLTDVQNMKLLLEKVLINDNLFYFPLDLLNANYNLGEVQSVFSLFAQNIVEYENFTSSSLIEQEKKSIQKQIAEQKNYRQNLNKQFSLKKKELNIAEKAYKREVELFEKGVISLSSMESAEQTYLTQQQSLQQLQTTISQAEIVILQLDEQLQKLSVQYINEKNQLFTSLKSSYRELLTSIQNWEQKYLLISPQAGYITFNLFWKENQFLTSGNKVFAIIPETPGEIIGKINVPASGSGKIKVKQQVNIKLAGFPYMEYGVLQGKINNISLVPNDEFYTIEVVLPNRLQTSINKELEFTGELIGTAEIITENKSLMSRLFTPLKYLTNKYF